MDNLIPFHKNEDGEILVSGRDLHEFLEIGKDFTNWFKDMIKYGFTEGEDFTPISAKSNGGRPRTDYVMTSDMAKELSMIQRTDRGKQARQYFIEMEKKANERKPLTIPEQLQVIAQGSIDLDKRVTSLESNMRVTGTQEHALQTAVNKRVMSILSGRDSPAYARLSKSVFKQCWHDFKKRFELPRYGELPQLKFDDGLNYINAWLPDTETRIEIANLNAQTDLFE